MVGGLPLMSVGLPHDEVLQIGEWVMLGFSREFVERVVLMKVLDNVRVERE